MRARTAHPATRRALSLALSLALTGGVFAAVPMQAAQAASTNTITLHVQSARTQQQFNLDGTSAGTVNAGDPIDTYSFIINEDNTGSNVQRSPADGCTPSDAGYPDSCHWASVAGLSSSAPVVTQGTQDDLSDLANLDLPDGRYLISVLAEGFKLDGLHFTLPRDPGLLTVELQPTPLPTATIKAQIFADVTQANGQFDPGEDGLAGFSGQISDTLGLVTTDVFGNPLCTTYVRGTGPNGYTWVDGAPVVLQVGGQCLSDASGELTIPNLGTNRYALTATPPDGQDWIQTTTLEGNHDWDAWVMEGSTGYDTEFAVAGEPFPSIIFGFVPAPGNGAYPLQASLSGAGTGTISGVVDAVHVYVPAKGGLPNGGTIWGGLNGGAVAGPIDAPWIVLNDLQQGDTAVWVGQGDANGHFSIPNVPPGNYSLTYWDEPQDYILDIINVTVGGGDNGTGENVDLGILPLTGWWTPIDGYVFDDVNRNGVKDEGEEGVPNFTLTMRRRDNSLMDRGTTTATTDAFGYYRFESTYPLTQWIILEAYNDLYYTTGVTYQADNQPAPTTVMGAGVDLNVLPIIGLSGGVNWGVHAYDATGVTGGLDPRNGGIVGTVSYDTTRNELDPRYAAVEDWQPGVSNLPVELYKPVLCGTTAAQCDASGRFELAADGSFAFGKLLNTYVTETWQRPTGCVARDVNGDPLVHGVDEDVLPTGADAPCLEGPLMGVQFGTFDGGTEFGSNVDGNYGFGDGCFTGTLVATDPSAPVCDGGDFTPLTSGNYLVHVVVPKDDFGKDLFNFTREEDINIGNGDQFIPQVPPPACAGALHTVDVAGIAPDGPNATVNPTFVDIGGSPYEGLEKPLCDTKLIPVQNGRSIVPTFNVFTDVPLPGRFFGYMVDDLNYSSDPKSLLYGEKAGVPFAPIGIYDYTNRLVTTAESDYNGVYDVLLPSTNRINCPTPSGVCGNVYRFVGNDPGVPGRLNTNYNPQYRTIAAEFEAIPGVIVPADNAPSQVGVSVQLPGGQGLRALSCPVEATRPELFRVSDPYVDVRTGAKTFTITGQGFGDPKGAGKVTLDGTIVLPTTTWTDRSIVVTVPADTPGGPYQLDVTADNGMRTIDGLTFHVLGYGAFPSTPVLDNFNRTGFGSNWSASTPPFAMDSNSVRVTGTGTMRWSGTAGGGPAYGQNQEAYLTFLEVSPTATEQGLFLKVTGSGGNPNPTDTSAAYIEVSYNAVAGAVQVRTKANGTNTVQLQGSIPATFGAGDKLGARALSAGTVNIYKNGTLLGSVNVSTGPNPWTAANVAGGGRIGIRFVGAQNNTTNDARFDDFGGGSVTGYTPNVYEVGPGKAFPALPYVEGNPPHPIQDALDAAAASPGDDLVVVYPNTPQGDRINPRGAYYENLVVSAPVKLQGVGPGGLYSDGTPVTGSIIDGSAFGGDTALADAWRTRVDALTWVGNQQVYDSEVIYLLARSQTQYGSAFKAAIDGFDLRGGDQMGFPNNINQIGGTPTGLPPNTSTQGGAIFANSYVRNLQITNNVVQANGGTFGTIRIGTPDLPAPDTNNHNEGVRIANNRIVANAGTNLAGGIGLFAGSDNYEVSGNDICGNFSSEYGGGLSVYGYSPNGTITRNRIYSNRSFDEGGGIMIAGELPADPSILSPGSGPVDITRNLIQSNLANDDGGGIRFLMAGNYQMNVVNNMIVDNVSTHEGGGIAINDAPNVRVINNTIMKNVTTATAITSNGFRAPAGLSTSANSDLLQATLPLGSPLFSDPLLFNDIFWDNRAGTRAGADVTGIGAEGAPNPVDNWDLGVADGTGSLSPTNSMLQTGDGTIASPTNQVGQDPQVVDPFDVTLSFAAWRTNPNFMGAIMVTTDVPPTAQGDYHIQRTSTARDAGAASKSSVAAPTTDFDGESRPGGPGFDIGADEIPTKADLSITKTDGRTVAHAGDVLTYTIVASNAGPDPVVGATVLDTFPGTLTGVTWTCASAGGATCPASGSGNINTTVDLPVGGTTTFTALATVSAGASGSVANTATVSATGTVDPTPGNNSATDTDTIPTADLSITKTDGQTSVSGGSTVTYTVVVTNNGPDAVTGATVTDTVPAALTGVAWTCSASAGSSCGNASGTGNAISTTADLANGGTATYTVQGTLSAAAHSGTLSNTATVAAPSGTTDPVTTNNNAADSDTIVPGLPSSTTLLDTFNRTNAPTLGTSWSQAILPLTGTTACGAVNPRAAIQVNTNQASACATGQAIWNAPSTGFAADQWAALTFSNTTINNDALVLKATGGTATTPVNFICVRAETGNTRVRVYTTTTGTCTQTLRGTINTPPVTFASGDRMTAVAYADGVVAVFKTSGATTTLLGTVSGTTFTGIGRIGMQLPSGARADDFNGGSLT